MYFSGQMIDDYSTHIASISPDSIADIIREVAVDSQEGIKAKYKDRSSVTVAGIITSKKIKALKNGDNMAFITVEDRYAQIEVVVFAKQYNQCYDLLEEESGVAVKGTLSLEDSESPKILLSFVEKLITNDDMGNNTKTDSAQKNVEKRFYIRVKSLNDERINKLQRICAFNSGKYSVVLFDESSKKYSVLKGATLTDDDAVVSRLNLIFSKENVVFK